MEKKNENDLVDWVYVHIDESEYPAIYRLTAKAANGVYLGVLDDINERDEIPASVPSKRFFRVVSTGDETMDYIAHFINPNWLHFHYPEAVQQIRRYIEIKMEQSEHLVH